MFRNTYVIKVALVPTTPTRESAHLCDTLAIITPKKDERLHAIAPVLLSLSDKHLHCLTVVYSCKPIFPSFSISTTFQSPQFEMPSLYISRKLLASVFSARKIIDAKKGNVHLAFGDVCDNLLLAFTE